MARWPRSTGKWPWSARPSSGLVPSTGLQSDALCPFSKPLRLATDHHRHIGRRSIPIEPAAPTRPHLSRLPALALLRRRPMVRVAWDRGPASEKPAQWLTIASTSMVRRTKLGCPGSGNGATGTRRRNERRRSRKYHRKYTGHRCAHALPTLLSAPIETSRVAAGLFLRYFIC